MKKFIALLLAAIMILSLAACELDKPADNGNDKDIGNVSNTESPESGENGDKENEPGDDHNCLVDAPVTVNSAGLKITFTKLEKIESTQVISYGSVVKEFDASEYRLHYEIINDSDELKTFLAGPFSINGVTVDENIFENAEAGEIVAGYASFFWYDFETAGIDKIMNIKCPTAKIIYSKHDAMVNVDIALDCGNLDYKEAADIVGEPVYDTNSVKIFVKDVERLNTISRTTITLAVVNEGDTYGELTTDTFSGNGSAVEKVDKCCKVHAGNVAYMEVEWSTSEVDALGGYLDNFSFVAHVENENGIAVDEGTVVSVDLATTPSK